MKMVNKVITIWYKNGQKKSEVIFKDGERRSETNWYKNGQKLSQRSSILVWWCSERRNMKNLQGWEFFYQRMEQRWFFEGLIE